MSVFVCLLARNNNSTFRLLSVVNDIKCKTVNFSISIVKLKVRILSVRWPLRNLVRLAEVPIL